MNKYTATFADGTTITRKTERQYAVAWRATWTCGGHDREETGFSYAKDKVNAYKPSPYYAGMGMSANDRAKARAKNAAFCAESNYRVEVAPAIKS
jgi:hypothetical protein